MKKFIFTALSICFCLLMVFCPSIINRTFDFFLWLVFVDNMDLGIPLWAEIVIKSISCALAFSAVGLLFNLTGWFNSNIMSVCYFIISILLGAVLSLALYCFANYWLAIFIVSLALLVCVIIIWVLVYIRRRKRLRKEKEQKE